MWWHRKKVWSCRNIPVALGRLFRRLKVKWRDMLLESDDAFTSKLHGMKYFFKCHRGIWLQPWDHTYLREDILCYEALMSRTNPRDTVHRGNPQQQMQELDRTSWAEGDSPAELSLRTRLNQLCCSNAINSWLKYCSLWPWASTTARRGKWCQNPLPSHLRSRT